MVPGSLPSAAWAIASGPTLTSMTSTSNAAATTPGRHTAGPKLANLLFTYELHRRLDVAGASPIAVAAHPGVSRTEMLRPPCIGADPAGLEGNWSLPELINGGDRDARFWRDSRRLRSGLLCPRGRLRSKPRRCATSRPCIQPTARTAIETRDQGMRAASCSGTHCTHS